MIEVISVPSPVAGAVSRLDIHIPVICCVGIKDGKLIASGGLAFGAGRAWIWFSTDDHEMLKGQGLKALRQCASMLRKARQLGETEVYATRDPKYDTSERLLKMAGFEKTDEILDNQEVWKVVLWPH